MSALEIELGGINDLDFCECCGNRSRTVWGTVYNEGNLTAAYYVQWTPNRLDHGANLDLVLGKWGEEASAAERSAVALEYRLLESGPAFMVIDATDRPMARSELVGQALNRSQVIGTPIAAEVFPIADAVLGQDPRVKELLGGWEFE